MNIKLNLLLVQKLKVHFLQLESPIPDYTLTPDWNLTYWTHSHNFKSNIPYKYIFIIMITQNVYLDFSIKFLI